MPERTSSRDWLKATLFVVCLVPMARLWILGLTGIDGGLGANPAEFIERSLGTWTLVALCLTLAVTPVRKLTGWTRLARLRRMLGQFTFFYGSAHLLSYVWFDQYFDVVAIAADIAKRPFILAGFVAYLLMVPLAITSTNAMMRRLGRRWQRLHRLVYLVPLAALLHYFWHKAGKQQFFEPTVYAVILGALLASRVVLRYLPNAARRPAQRVASGSRRSSANSDSTDSRSRTG